ncbi:chloride channel [Aureococcus anophagefferens]|nr:chloride channel [Aureococcus anophagefferens]
MDASWTTTWSARARARRILRCVVLGCAVALMNSGLVSVIGALFQLRTNYAIKEHEDRGDFRAALGRLVLIDAALAGAAAFLVAYVAPAAQGSGLSELKGFLNGSRIPGLWQLRTFVVKYRENDRKRLYATLGGAAGIATAFNAPVGGVLYVFEEISSYWDHEKTFYACLSTTVAVAAQKYLSQALHGGSMRFQSLVIFDEARPPAAPRGVALARFAKFAEAVAVCVVIGVAFFLLPKLGACRARDDGHRRRLAGGERHYRAYDCGAGRYNDLASLTLVGEEGAIKALLARDVAKPFSGASLGVFVAAYFLCFSAIAGLSIPIGTFVPNCVEINHWFRGS